MPFIDEPAVKQLTENWQRVRRDRLQSAFAVFDSANGRTERVVTFRSSGIHTEKLLGRIEDRDDFHFLVHLGLRAKLLTDKVPERPAFTLLLQVVNGKQPGFEDCIELDWCKSRFSEAAQTITDSEANAIPAAGAYLFIHSWLGLDDSRITDPFLGKVRFVGERVRSYEFTAIESLSILEDIERSHNGTLDIHLGDGVAVYSHPFSFRPVVEVHNAVQKGEKRRTPMNASGLLNGRGDSFYDYSRPFPPGSHTN